MKKILFIRHIEIEGPGTFGGFLRENGIPFEILDAAKIDSLLSLLKSRFQEFCGVVVLGGPMNADEDQKYSFLAAEKGFIRHTIACKIPLLGICLGAQLIASSLGASVRRAKLKEIGWYDMVFEKNAQLDPLTRVLRPEMKVFQWHEDTFDLPQGAVLLAQKNGMNQAFRFSDTAWGFQFHIEVDDKMIKSWFDEYVKETTPEPACTKLLDDYVALGQSFQGKVYKFYQAFTDIACPS